MATLLLRLAAPMQSWGDESKFNERLTRREPTKSGVIGMIASAAGVPRDADLTKYTSMRFGVRIDHEGTGVSEYDYQIVRPAFFQEKKPLMPSMNGNYIRSENGELVVNDKDTILTRRYYLFDAVFLAGLEGDEFILREIADALQHPMWPLYLGRRSCPPAGKVLLGIRETSLENALSGEPLQVPDNMVRQKNIRMVIESKEIGTDTYLQKDEPYTFSKKRRRFGQRACREVYLPVQREIDHDPMAALN